MLLHIFDLDIVSFRDVERANSFEETERDYGIYSAGHLVDWRRAQANRRSNRLQAGDREVAARWKSSTGSSPLTEALARVVIGAVLSVFVALAALRARTLATSGAIAAAVVGTICLAAGWNWGALLLAMFVSASALSRLGERQKAERVGPVVEKGDERDATQVLANGGLYAAAALGSLLAPSPIWYAIGAGTLAASAADTWATEVGTLAGGEPISIVSGRRVAPGTSGGITLVGTVAGVVGAVFIAAAAALANWQVPFAAVALAGVAGALADSLLGATVQARRWCELCAKSTERLVHSCGTMTSHARGLAGFDNDAVNAVCSGVGALVALLLS
jgi:uncharacterized protein (TIGR00297 family)